MADFALHIDFTKSTGNGYTGHVYVKAWVDPELGVTTEFYSTKTGKRLPESFDAWLKLRDDFDRLVTMFERMSRCKERPFDG